MSSPADISILLPARNAAATLPACLRSIQRQRYSTWHCLIIDDGSTDATADCVRAFAAGDARFELQRQQHRGLVASLNTGLALCHGRFIARMDADDIMHRDRLVAQAAQLDGAPHLSAVGCHVRLFPRHTLGPGWREYEAWLNSLHTADDVQADAFVECPLAHPTLLLRRDVARAYGYRDVAWPEDYDLLLRLLADGHQLGVVPRRLVGWRQHAERLTHRDPRYRREAFPICKAHFLSTGLLSGHERYILWGYGGTGRSLRCSLLPYGKHPAYVVEMHAGRLGNQIHGAAVISPEQLRDIPHLPLIASVAGTEPRQQIRRFVTRLGWQEGRDFVCAA
ncbi:MAG: glycosyltransferase [Deltaproteobacteria bacterium]|nr:glycosyltransferase [Deltaproteobacteria bacterium]